MQLGSKECSLLTDRNETPVDVRSDSLTSSSWLQLRFSYGGVRPALMNIPVVQLSLPELSGQRGAEMARHCLEAGGVQVTYRVTQGSLNRGNCTCIKVDSSRIGRYGS